MKKEKIKTVILCLLIINCIQLTGQIWLDKKLWPSGYNFFSYAENIPIVGKIISKLNLTDTTVQGEIMYADSVTPEKVIVGDGGGRAVYYSDEDTYKDVLKMAADTLALVTPDLPSEEIEEGQIETYLVSKCFCIDFGYEATIGFLYDALDIETTDGFTGNILADNIIISAEAPGNKIAVCFVSGKDSTAVRYILDGGGDKITRYIEKLKISAGQNHAFAFDLNLDKTENAQSSLLLSPFALLNLDMLKGQAVTVTAPFGNEDEVSEFSDRMITAFGYTPNSIRRVVRNDGIVKYVENNATVTVSPDGRIEYVAATETSGIRLKTPDDPSSVVKEILGMTGNIYKASDVTSIAVLHPVESLGTSGNGNYNINMDYYVYGIPVKFGDNGGSAVSAIIVDGHISKFTLQIANITKGEGTLSWISVLDALDIYADRNIDNRGVLNLSDISECYRTDGENTVAGWLIKQTDGTKTVIVK